MDLNDPMNYFKHPTAIVESPHVGDHTRVWAFTHILPGAQIGEDCNLCDHVFVENEVVLGSRVTVKSSVQLWDGVTVEDDVFIGPNATFTNDSFPRSKKRPEKYEKTVIRRGASIGANATILCGIEIGRNAMVGAGAVVTRSVPPNAVVVGNPARIMGYGSGASPVSFEKEKAEKPRGPKDVGVAGVKVLDLPFVEDMRGNLSFAQYSNHLPFPPKRYFLVFDVPSKEVRGEHAHRKLQQLLICVKGSLSVLVDDGEHRAEVVLDRPNIGLYLPPMVWGIQYKYTRDAVLLVLASDGYDANDYIREYEEFMRLVGKK
jgi:UDP-2-acetamido-3-amino-2,3-dideoxy-glucuronate N-acetyltransferase